MVLNKEKTAVNSPVEIRIPPPWITVFDQIYLLFRHLKNARCHHNHKRNIKKLTLLGFNHILKVNATPVKHNPFTSHTTKPMTKTTAKQHLV
jgi:hypothetical protein